MNIIAVYVMAKENLSKEIADKVVEYYMSGMKYEEALEMAKELYSK